MSIVQLLRALGGVARRKTLLRSCSRAELRAALAAGEIVRDARGRYAVPVAHEARRAANRLSGVVSHRSAALHLGWEVKTVPDRPEVTIGRKRHLAAGQADGVELHWADLGADEVTTDDVTSIDRTLVDCLRSLPFDEALAVADSALRHRDISKPRLIELAGSIKGPGARQARRVAQEATHLAANPFESVLRAIGLDVPALHLVAQVVIADHEGRGRADLVDRERRLVIEAESHSFHSRRGALRRDCRRYTKLVLLGWRVLRFAWEDVMFHPDYVRRCLVEAARLTDEQAQSAGTVRPAA